MLLERFIYIHYKYGERRVVLNNENLPVVVDVSRLYHLGNLGDTNRYAFPQ
jgi:hypothetical protein